MKIIKKQQLKTNILLNEHCGIKCDIDDLDLISDLLINEGFIADNIWNEIMKKDFNKKEDNIYILFYNKEFAFHNHAGNNRKIYTINDLLI